jgi:hypothetical protein
MPDHTGTATVVVEFAQWIFAAVALLEVSEFLPKISRFIRGLRIPGSDPELKKDFHIYSAALVHGGDDDNVGVGKFLRSRYLLKAAQILNRRIHNGGHILKLWRH